tara:strand:- start:404 stop:529 length:126 start_codon:yes stop_codon:yes gene_type:complete
MLVRFCGAREYHWSLKLRTFAVIFNAIGALQNLRANLEEGI